MVDIKTNITPSSFYQQASDTLAYGVSSVLSSASSAASKMYGLGQRYLTRDYVTEKITNAAKAKFMPLSDPAGWDAKIAEPRATVARLTPIKHIASRQLKDLKHLIATVESQPDNERDLGPLVEKQASFKKIYEATSERIDAAREEINYLETQRQLQIGARFASYVGHGTNVLLPGAGTASSLLITGASIMAQQQLVEKLPQKSTIVQKERFNVFCGTCATVACTIASLAFSVWCMPYLKSAINIKS